MPLTLTYRGETTVPVEVEGIVPSRLKELSAAEVEKLNVFHGNEKLPLAEFFSVNGDAGDQQLRFAGNLTGVHWMGAGMDGGEVVIEGNAGRHVGADMRGGTLRVNGNVSDHLGAEMHGGLIHVHGRAGHLVGAAYRGSPKGMTRGTILVDGDAGNEIGLSMRRGLIAIGGSAGDAAGFNMIAGSVLVFGGCGIRPGAGMKRGTIALFGDEPPGLLPTFKEACRYQPQFLRFYLKELARLEFAFAETLLDATFTRYCGDLVALGKGEVLLRQ